MGIVIKSSILSVSECFDTLILYIYKLIEVFCPGDPNFVLPEEAKNLVMHTRLNILGSNVMFSDVFPGMPYTVGNNISLAIVSKNIDEVKSLFEKL